ncbi:MAG: glycosyltransferase family 4 protein [Candidatus Thorarchaeota archaeon]
MSDKKLKILYVDFDLPHLLKDDDYPAGGIANEWLSWINGIKRTGNKIGVLTWKGAKNYINKDIDLDIIESFELKKGMPILKLLYYRFPFFLKAVKNYNPDIIIQEGASNLTFLSAITSKILNKTFVYRIASDKDVDERIDKIKKIFGWRSHILHKIALRYTDIFVSQNNYQHTVLKKKFPNKKVFTLYNPYIIKNSSVSNLKENERSFIAWIGNFRHEKNIPALVSITKSLPHINFKIAGKPLHNIDRVSEDAFKELEKIKNVELIGYLKRSEVVPFLSNAIALLNTSYLEGFSNTFLEAWAAGTPVITTQNVNPDNLITKYKLGVVANNYDDLPDIISKITNSGIGHDFSVRCREYVEKYHDPEVLANELIELVK